MENGVVYFPKSRNIGDDIQTYAASLLVDNPQFCDRERLDLVEAPTKLLCNGWFKEDAAHWPPSKAVQPLFTSFHISTKNVDSMTTPEAIDYYKKYQPIGCRDYHTVNILEKFGVEAYFSGCITLTLPKVEAPRGNEILFVDVLRTNYTDAYRQTVVNNIIPDAYRDKISFVTHFSEDLHKISVEDRMKQAKEMLDRYSKAKLVFTSLIHCALPCVALGTPVVFVDFGFNNNAAKRDRFNGIIDLFHIVSDLEAPYMNRDLKGKLGRGLGLYKMSQDKISKLPESLFEYNTVTNGHLEIVDNFKKSISQFYNS